MSNDARSSNAMKIDSDAMPNAGTEMTRREQNRNQTVRSSSSLILPVDSSSNPVQSSPMRGENTCKKGASNHPSIHSSIVSRDSWPRSQRNLFLLRRQHRNSARLNKWYAVRIESRCQRCSRNIVEYRGRVRISKIPQKQRKMTGSRIGRCKDNRTNGY
jgi:hypothetical protein